MMKKIFTLLLLGIGFGASAQNLGVNTFAPKATLDVVGNPSAASTPDGILVPRITLTQLSAKTGYGTDQTGAVIYVSDATGTTNAATLAVGRVGYYRFDGTRWMPMMPKFVGFHATASANPSPSLTAGETRQIVFNAEGYDSNDWFDMGTGRFAPKLAGYYDVSISARVYNSANNDGTRNVQLFKNGVVHAIGHTTSDNIHVVGLNSIVYMNGTSDFLEARIYTAEAITITGTSPLYTYFQANLIGQ